MTIVLDSGALIAIDRGRRDLLARLQTAFENGDQIRAPAGVIGQVWRHGARQTLLSRALNRCEETLKGLYAANGGLRPRIRLVGGVYHITPQVRSSLSR